MRRDPPRVPQDDEPSQTEAYLDVACTPALIDRGSTTLVTVLVKNLVSRQAPRLLELTLVSDDGDEVQRRALQLTSPDSLSYEGELSLGPMVESGTYRVVVVWEAERVEAWDYLYVVDRGGAHEISMLREALDHRARAADRLGQGDVWGASASLEACAVQFETMHDIEYAALVWRELAELHDQCGQPTRAADCREHAGLLLHESHGTKGIIPAKPHTTEYATPFVLPVEGGVFLDAAVLADVCFGFQNGLVTVERQRGAYRALETARQSRGASAPPQAVFDLTMAASMIMYGQQQLDAARTPAWSALPHTLQNDYVRRFLPRIREVLEPAFAHLTFGDEQLVVLFGSFVAIMATPGIEPKAAFALAEAQSTGATILYTADAALTSKRLPLDLLRGLTIVHVDDAANRLVLGQSTAVLHESVIERAITTPPEGSTAERFDRVYSVRGLFASNWGSERVVTTHLGAQRVLQFIARAYFERGTDEAPSADEVDFLAHSEAVRLKEEAGGRMWEHLSHQERDRVVRTILPVVADRAEALFTGIGLPGVNMHSMLPKLVDILSRTDVPFATAFSLSQALATEVAVVFTTDARLLKADEVLPQARTTRVIDAKTLPDGSTVPSEDEQRLVVPPEYGFDLESLHEWRIPGLPNFRQ